LLKAKQKSGGPKIVLETDYSNIHIRARGGEGDQATKAELNPDVRRSKRVRRVETVR